MTDHHDEFVVGPNETLVPCIASSVRVAVAVVQDSTPDDPGVPVSVQGHILQHGEYVPADVLVRDQVVDDIVSDDPPVPVQGQILESGHHVAADVGAASVMHGESESLLDPWKTFTDVLCACDFTPAEQSQVLDLFRRRNTTLDTLTTQLQTLKQTAKKTKQLKKGLLPLSLQQLNLIEDETIIFGTHGRGRGRSRVADSGTVVNNAGDGGSMSLNGTEVPQDHDEPLKVTKDSIPVLKKPNKSHKPNGRVVKFWNWYLLYLSLRFPC